MRLTCLVAALLFGSVSASRSDAAILYHATDLGALTGGNNTSKASGINSLGQVVGTSSVTTPDGKNRARAFLWTSAGGMQDLGPAAGLESAAHGINDYGQVVGVDYRYAPDGTPNGYDAVVWNGAGGFQVYGPLAGDDTTVAEAINNIGQLAGASQIFDRPPDGIDRPVMWNSAGVIQSLGPLPGGNGHGYAHAINDSGQIAGSASAPGGSHAFRWTSEGGMQNLGDLPGGSNFSLGLGIGNSGAVVGLSITSGGSHAFIWRSNTGMQDLGDLPRRRERKRCDRR
jgi:probable HAF family extracellular repeat protein